MDVIEMYNILIYIKNSVSGVDHKHTYTVKTIEDVLQFIYDYKDYITQNAWIEIIKNSDLIDKNIEKDVKK